MIDEEQKWQPLSVRNGLREPYEPVTGVPGFLMEPILVWVQKVCRYAGRIDEDIVRQIAAQFRIFIPATEGGYGAFGYLSHAMKEHPDVALDIVDYLVFQGAGNRELADLFDAVDHEYSVSDDGKRLVERIPKEAKGIYQAATDPGDHAANLLHSAWAKTFSRDTDPKGAWEDAKGAVENLLKPVVSPNDANTTISKMAKALRDKPAKWSCSLNTANGDDPVLAFAKSLELVWYPPARHGQPEPVDPLTSRTAVLQSVTICQWLRDGVLQEA